MDFDALDFAFIVTVTEPFGYCSSQDETEEDSFIVQDEDLQLPHLESIPIPQAGRSLWDRFIGQDRLKSQLQVHMDSAKKRGVPLQHVLLASGWPGVGKTELSKAIAQRLDVDMTMMVPPLSKATLIEATRDIAESGGVLFIDEIHKIADGGVKNAEILLHLLEEGIIYDGMIQHNRYNITVIGATTDRDKLPETIVDRFPIKPEFDPYSIEELALISARFEGLNGIELPFETTLGIAKASRGTPRFVRELVESARDIYIARGEYPTIDELLEFKQLEPNGIGIQHKRYLQLMVEKFSKPDGTSIAGAETLRVMLRETPNGLMRIERFLVEQGLLDYTPRGRMLTARGRMMAKAL